MVASRAERDKVRSEEKEIKSESLGHAGVYSLSTRCRQPFLSLQARVWPSSERGEMAGRAREDGGTLVMSQPMASTSGSAD